MTSTGLRETQCRNLPVFVVDGKRTPEIAINDRSAIDKGHPLLLHYAKNKGENRDNRELAGCMSAWTGSGSCDEYPFASTREGGLGAQTRGVPLSEQMKQGSDLSAFYRSNKMQRNDEFLVAVINVRRREDGTYVAG
ncbi:NucA/NucB deoxyribonuclease domain-containing protein [Streptomyces akebiae]|uniref:NucA/NucB deoxyribonuclease domain-containing protein n=1 Tax=Streptomyces akebiae TaxID=2865673 RepID=UPI002175C23D|nr:NucA/NucB deoxyribonuclease domain-containing protein [Streptomyces akebiae]